MNWTLIFIIAMPALFGLVVFAMYKFGIGKTDWDATPAEPYRDPTERQQLKIIAGFSFFLYLLALFAVGPLGAAIVLAVLLMVQLIAVLVFTSIQEIVFWSKGPKRDPETGAIVERRTFPRRLLWNFFNSYEVVAYLVP